MDRSSSSSVLPVTAYSPELTQKIDENQFVPSARQSRKAMTETHNKYSVFLLFTVIFFLQSYGTLHYFVESRI
ncbi:hypothetical protein HMPREF3038_02033 [Akkermansia sp. KLE1797]|nr:hypothetical protein HMPREF3038_02033 [Akkermansia sp. KLE1797]KXU53633.1 hypothetical protein HMPREF3039_02356 [Akkermansia sp. KLE1798]KZA05669.1 hypothetical protein HMPREF1326_00657 [Akkermansia sp. KLE1605]